MYTFAFSCTQQKPLKRITIEEIGEGPTKQPLDSTKPTEATTVTVNTEQKVTEPPNTPSIVPITETINHVDGACGEPPTVSDVEPSKLTKPLINTVTHKSETLEETDKNISSKTEVGKKTDSVESKELLLPSSTKMSVTSTGNDQLGHSESSDMNGVVDVPSQPAVQLKLPSVPDNSISLQADWKRLKKDRKLLGVYFKVHYYCVAGFYPE